MAEEREMNQGKLIQSIIDNLDGGSKRFAFLLGAGASRKSVIPDANTLAKRWREELKESDHEAYNSLKEEIKQSNNLAAHYSEIFDKRF